MRATARHPTKLGTRSPCGPSLGVTVTPVLKNPAKKTTTLMNLAYGIRNRITGQMRLCGHPLSVPIIALHPRSCANGPASRSHLQNVIPALQAAALPVHTQVASLLETRTHRPPLVPVPIKATPRLLTSATRLHKRHARRVSPDLPASRGSVCRAGSRQLQT
jgi:hypothetical protein